MGRVVRFESPGNVTVVEEREAELAPSEVRSCLTTAEAIPASGSSGTVNSGSSGRRTTAR
jgi:hypothetical protein